MTKICSTRCPKSTYGKLKTGDCFYDENDLFCIKIDDSSCLYILKEVLGHYLKIVQFMMKFIQ